MSEATWAAANVPAMWASAQAADTQMAWEQVGAWSRTHELLLFHESRLKMLQIELSEAWPPSKGSAAFAFVEYIDGLLTRVAQARHDAGKNREALQLLLESLSLAKKDMAPLKAKWDKYQAEETSRSQNLTNSLPHSGGSTWQEDLNTQARARMVRNDQEVFEASRLMVIPLGSNPSIDTSNPYGDNPSGGPIGGTGWPAGPMDAPSPPQSSDLSNSIGTGVAPGPQLAGAGSLAPLPSVVVPPGASTQGGQPSPMTPPLFNSGVAFPNPNAGGSSSKAIGDASLPRPRSGQSRSTLPLTSVGGRSPVGRVNPVGGVISSTPAGGVAGVPPGRIGGAGARSDTDSFEPTPTLHWEVASGGPPVIEPPVERPFELGPGVIGIDR